MLFLPLHDDLLTLLTIVWAACNAARQVELAFWCIWISSSFTM